MADEVKLIFDEARKAKVEGRSTRFLADAKVAALDVIFGFVLCPEDWTALTLDSKYRWWAGPKFVRTKDEKTDRGETLTGMTLDPSELDFVEKLKSQGFRVRQMNFARGDLFILYTYIVEWS